jgi:hypothetical protein
MHDQLIQLQQMHLGFEKNKFVDQLAIPPHPKVKGPVKQLELA